ncbi:MAG TPA: APC family permease [Ohtaekwangia sp.]
MNQPDAQHHTNKYELKKVLGVGFGIAVLVGGTIGVGILRAPGTIAAQLNNYWLIILCWTIGGMYVLFGAGSFAEMATSMPRAGGTYNYVKRAFNDYFGFLIGWFDYIVNAIAPAYFCIVISEYIVLLSPPLARHEKLIAIAFLLFFTLFHLGGVKNGSRAQQIMSLIKVIFFAILIVACFTVKVEHLPAAESSPVVQSGMILAFLRSLQLIMGAYDGWWTVCFFAEEDKDPSKNIPRSLFVGGITIMTIYIVLNMAILHVLPPSALQNSTLAASDAARVVFGDSGATFVTVIAIASLVSILNAYMMIPARIIFGLSREGFFIRQGMVVNSGGTPVTGLLITSALAVILILVGSFEQLFSLDAFLAVGIMASAFASHIKLRISEPEMYRPFRAWGYPVVPVILLLSTVCMFIGFSLNDPVSLIAVVIILLVSWPAYRLLNRNKT